jgi:hypothetical protein
MPTFEQKTVIPPEFRADIVARQVFFAVRDGDWQEAERAQKRLAELGWYLTRTPPKPERTRRRKDSD